MSPTIAPGTCRHCCCTEDNACLLQAGEPCCWIDRSRLVCNNPECIKAEQARVASARAARPPSPYKGWGFGAVIEEKERQKRSERRRKARKGGRAA